MDLLYIFEILVEDLQFTDFDLQKLSYDQIKMKVKCDEIINLVLESDKNQKQNKGDLRVSPFSAGKSLLFPGNSKKFAKMLETQQLEIQLIKSEVFGVAKIPWPSHFVDAAKRYEREDEREIVQHNQVYNILTADKHGKLIGTFNVSICINCFGKNVEIDFQVMASQMDVMKIKQRLKSSGTSAEKQLKQQGSEPWDPLFVSPFKQQVSVMEPEMRIYAQMAGIIPPPSRLEKLTPEYITRNLCGHKNCPVAQKFKEFGLGPLAVGKGIGAVDVRNTRPDGLYGMSQTYGCLEHYGAYGLFVKGMEKLDTCGSPNCPYTAIKQQIISEKLKGQKKEKTKKCKCCSKKKLKEEEEEQRCTCCCKAKTKRQSAGADYEYAPCSDGKPCPLALNQGACGGKPCPFGSMQEKELLNVCGSSGPCPLLSQPKETSTRLPPCGNKTCSFDLSEVGNCGGQVCPLTAPDNEKCKDASCSKRNKEERQFSFSNDESLRQFRFGERAKKANYVSREFLNTFSVSDDIDMYLLLGQMAAAEQAAQYRSYSMNNYYEMSDSMYLLSDTDKKKKKKKNKAGASCTKDTCSMSSSRYKTCSECGGLSRSGATCDNTDVSFDKISYDNYVAGSADMYSSNPEFEVKGKSEEQVQPGKEMKPVAKAKNVEVIKPVAPTKPTPFKRAARRNRFVYHAGEFYPNNLFGHKMCAVPAKNVPAQMGWLWNIEPQGRLRKRKGWRPGHLNNVINERIIQRRRELGIPDPPELKMLVARRKIRLKAMYDDDESDDEEIQPKPTLTIQKKENAYLITLNPLKDPHKLADNENPYMDCRPMQFLITRKKNLESIEEKRKLKDVPEEGEGEAEAELETGSDDNNNYYKTSCYCDEDLDLLEEESSSDSELNIEFTTPAGLIIPERMKRLPNVVHTDTQFSEKDLVCPDCHIIVPTKYAKPKKKARIRATRRQ